VPPNALRRWLRKVIKGAGACQSQPGEMVNERNGRGSAEAVVRIPRIFRKPPSIEPRSRVVSSANYWLREDLAKFAVESADYCDCHDQADFNGELSLQRQSLRNAGDSRLSTANSAMHYRRQAKWRSCFALMACWMLSGCTQIHTPPAMPPMMAAPPVGTGNNKVSLPTYTIEPPDVLQIDAIRVVPKAPYKIEPLDFLGINVTGTLRDQPILGTYGVEPGGGVNLGPSYGRVQVSGLTLEEASEAIYRQLSRSLKQPQVSVTLAASSGQQQINGQHRVGLDGTVNLGEYGTVQVTGLTVEQAKQSIEAHLAQFLEKPEVSVDVFTYQSKVYYVIGQGAGFGDSLVRLQITGNETVLDAISQVNGLSRVASKRIWIARPAPNGCIQRLDVSWADITQKGEEKTNYQIMPGDRIYLAENKMIATDSFVNKLLTPIERVFGFATQGATSIEEIKHPSEFARQ
jgi:polysaccharide biosynthesis/export protein